MAIWQVHFMLIPKEKAYIENLEEVISWRGFGIKEESIDDMSRLLIYKKSWCKDIKQFGSLEETCIELLYDEQVLEEISLRIDLRSISLNVLKEIIKFIQKNNAMVLTHEKRVVQPILEEIIKELNKSDASKFLKNPEEFFLQLNEE